FCARKRWALRGHLPRKILTAAGALLARARNGLVDRVLLGFLAGEGVIQGGQGGNHGRFGAQNQLAKGGFRKAMALGRLELRVRPAAFGTDGQGRGGGGCGVLAFQEGAEEGRVGAFGEQESQAPGRVRRKSSFRPRRRTPGREA